MRVYIEPYRNKYIAGFYDYTTNAKCPKRVYADAEGPILFDRWLDAYDHIMHVNQDQASIQWEPTLPERGASNEKSYPVY